MKSCLRLSILCVLLLATGWAHAGPADDTRAVFKTLLTSVPVPPEWEGIWVTVDSTDNCFYPDGASASSSEYWICAGGDFYPDVTCTGTATATTLHLHCGSMDCGDECCSGYSVTFDVTRNGDSFDSVEVYEAFWGCGYELCTTLRAHGTRTGPVPKDYCVTPVLPTTWGGVKAMYR